ncbi:MAG: hypothetical protein WCS70_06910 [Verrucomicrobiota bacterium]
MNSALAEPPKRPTQSNAKPIPPPEIEWLTLPNAAKRADVSVSTIRRWARQGLVVSGTCPSGRLRVDGGALTKESLFNLKVDRILAGII